MFDLIIMAMMSALGIAIKPIIVPLAHIISGPLFIPSGAVAGGFYMMWLVLGFGITGKRGTMTLIGLVQAILVMATGIVGSHGVISLVTYTAPGILADLGLLLIGHRVCCLPCAFLAGMLCNIAGSIMVNFVYFRLPLIPLVLSLSAAALSGGLGGIVAYKILQQILKFQKRGGNTSEERDPNIGGSGGGTGS
ncbi:ECF transporter S component [Pelotomaculum terephthalicicum JT]|uniref:ECF transporter S component n=1 Tax=Pelotomaculum terephthalicicum TaxID=206393 RepID=UPI001F034186|nr:ECF transporter S component [Pelotomaculum terephthalicicum]MCG9967273.1 ECF transporter S component [Pelotomaculum terephthalicicum JT]